jgi:hypothetical protein
MFVGKAEATKVTSTLKTFAGDKHSSLINLNVTELKKKFYNIHLSMTFSNYRPSDGEDHGQGPSI